MKSIAGLSSVVAVSFFFVGSAVIGCPGGGVIAEGEVDGEGEGDVVAEGEGDAAEGEGDGVVGEGEGDGVTGEGEGDIVAGEGEGDVVVGDVYADGEFAVTVNVIDGDTPLRIFVPEGTGPFPIIQFQHGFLMSTEWYTTMLSHVASHGFVVVAPQMYAADNIPLFKPDISEEATAAEAVTAGLSALDLGVAVDGRVFAAGHSRGGKVVWKMLTDNNTLFDGVLLLDPVDGSQGGGRVVDDTIDFNLPTLIVGTGLGPQSSGGFGSQPCAPAGDNSVEFTADAPADAVSLVATDAGHNDLLDDTTPGCAVCGVCLAGTDPAAVRTTFGGLLVAFFSGFSGAVDDVLADAPVALTPR